MPPIVSARPAATGAVNTPRLPHDGPQTRAPRHDDLHRGLAPGNASSTRSTWARARTRTGRSRPDRGGGAGASRRPQPVPRVGDPRAASRDRRRRDGAHRPGARSGHRDVGDGRRDGGHRRRGGGPGGVRRRGGRHRAVLRLLRGRGGDGRGHSSRRAVDPLGRPYPTRCGLAAGRVLAADAGRAGQHAAQSHGRRAAA